MVERCTRSKTLIRALVKLQLYIVIGFVVVLLPLYSIYTFRRSGIITDQILLFTIFIAITAILLYIWYRATDYLIVEKQIV